jgi:hypothetical protein
MRLFEQNFKTTFHPFPKYESCELCYLQLKETLLVIRRISTASFWIGRIDFVFLIRQIRQSVVLSYYEHCQPEPIDDDETLLVIRRISSTAD